MLASVFGALSQVGSSWLDCGHEFELQAPDLDTSYELATVFEL